MSAISALWKERRLPILDGLHFLDGRSYALRINAAMRGGIEILEEIDLASVLRVKPDSLTSIDITNETKIAYGNGYLCCGEGSYGSEGFFALVDGNKDLEWVVYLEESNPFTEILINGAWVTFTSTSGVSVTVDMHRPQFSDPYTRLWRRD